MEIFKTIDDIKTRLSQLTGEGKTVGFVPTMGALHKGHLSLLETAKKETDISVVSIFVNPTQFNDKDDFIKYPRNDERDLLLLSQHFCDIVFLPSENEMYPEPDERVFDLGNLENIMEGKFRPGHFQGVAKVVSKFFDIVKPHKAFFGQKDFQQLAIIKRLVDVSGLRIEIVGCPIIREENGLAMSSRNQRLTPGEFSDASIIYGTIKQLPVKLKSTSLSEAKAWAEKTINSCPGIVTEYIETVDNESLAVIDNLTNTHSFTCCVAVFCGKVRLIDNIQIFL